MLSEWLKLDFPNWKHRWNKQKTMRYTKTFFGKMVPYSEGEWIKYRDFYSCINAILLALDHEDSKNELLITWRKEGIDGLERNRREAKERFMALTNQQTLQ